MCSISKGKLTLLPVNSYTIFEPLIKYPFTLKVTATHLFIGRKLDNKLVKC